MIAQHNPRWFSGQMFRTAVALAISSTFFAQAAWAERLPGHASADLEVAVEQWLNSDEPLDAFRPIGTLAARGNIAAQVWSNFLANSQVAGSSGTSLTRDEILDLFPPSPDENQTHRFRPYTLNPDAFPALAARLHIGPSQSLEAWTASATLLLEAGLRLSVFQAREAEWSLRRFDIEAALLVADHIRPGDRAISDFWAALLMEDHLLRTIPDPGRAIRWTETPEELLQRTGFYEALHSESWAAIRASAFPSLVTGRVSESAAIEAARRLFHLKWGLPSNEPADIDRDLWTLGLALSETPLPYLEPLARVCSEACGTDFARCLASGAMSGLDHTASALRLEPVLDPERYYASLRAKEEVLAALQNQSAQEAGRRVPLPRCLRQIASDNQQRKPEQ